MRINKTLIFTTTITALIAGTITVAARWHFRGGSVFDAQRFADSVKVTAEWVKQAVNQAEMLTNQILINTGIAGIGEDFNSIKNSVSDVTSSMDSLLNTGRNFTDLNSGKEYTVEEAIKKYKELTANIQTDAETLVNDSLRVNSSAGYQNEKTDKEVKSIAETSSPGVLAEQQKANALAILQAQKMIEAAKLTYTAGVRDLVVTNLQGKQETLAEAANVQLLVKPLTSKQLKNSEKNNIGLLRIK